MSSRAALPIVGPFEVSLPDAEHQRLSQLAQRILQHEPGLPLFEAFGPGLAPGLDEGPALLFEDDSETTLFSCAEDETLQYRSLRRAGISAPRVRGDSC